MAVWGREGQLGCGMLQKDPGGRRKHKVCCHCVTEFVAENSAICLSEGGCQREVFFFHSVDQVKYLVYLSQVALLGQTPNSSGEVHLSNSVTSNVLDC